MNVLNVTHQEKKQKAILVCWQSAGLFFAGFPTFKESAYNTNFGGQRILDQKSQMIPYWSILKCLLKGSSKFKIEKQFPDAHTSINAFVLQQI